LGQAVELARILRQSTVYHSREQRPGWREIVPCDGL